MEEQIYLRSEASKITGVGIETIKNWVRYGFIDQLSGSNSKSGWRRYTFKELIRLKILSELTKYGIPPSTANTMAQIAELVLQGMTFSTLNEVISAGKHLKPMYLVHFNEHSSIEDDISETLNKIIETKSPVGPATILPIAPIILEINNKVKELYIDD